MSPNYILKQVEAYESWAIPEFHSTVDMQRWRWLDKKLNQACYIRLRMTIKLLKKTA